MGKIVVRHVTVPYNEEIGGYEFTDVALDEHGRDKWERALYVERIDNFTVIADNQTASAFVHYFYGGDGVDKQE